MYCLLMFLSFTLPPTLADPQFFSPSSSVWDYFMHNWYGWISKYEALSELCKLTDHVFRSCLKSEHTFVQFWIIYGIVIGGDNSCFSEIGGVDKLDNSCFSEIGGGDMSPPGSAPMPTTYPSVNVPLVIGQLSKKKKALRWALFSWKFNFFQLFFNAWCGRKKRREGTFSNKHSAT